jgi:plasmid stabilization system protein ParE
VRAFIVAVVIALAGARPVAAQTAFPAFLMLRDSIVEVDSVVSEQFHPAVEAELWSELETCTGLTASDSLRAATTFVAVPGHGFTVHGKSENGAPYVAYAAVEGRVVLILHRRMEHRQILKHEMLHILLYDTGKVVTEPWHPVEWFGPCGVLNQ